MLPAMTANAAANPDSIMKLIDRADPGERPALYYALGHAYYDIDSMLLAARAYGEAAEAAGLLPVPDHELMCKGYINAGHAYNILNRFREAIANLEKGLQTAIEQGIRLQESIAYLNLGTNYFNLGDYDQAARFFRQSLAIDQELGDEEGIGINYANLGKVYEAWEKYDMALAFYKDALHMSEAIGDSARMAIRLSSVAMAYRGMKQYDQAIARLSRALEIDRNLGSEARVGIRLSNLGQIYLDMGHAEEAKNHLLNAIDIFKRVHNIRSLSIALNQLGHVYQQTGRISEAIDLYTESLAFAREIELLATMMTNHLDLSKAYEENGMFQAALENHKMYSQLKDSIFTDQSRQTLQEIETRYEIARNEAEIALLTRESEAKMLQLQRSQWRMGFFLAVSVMLIILVIILVSRYRIKQQANKQLQLLNATKDRFFTIIAHDLKNPLASFRNITLGVKNALPELKEEDISYYINEIHQSASQLHELLTNLLQWSKSQAGLFKSCKQQVPVQELVNNVLNGLRADIRQKEITMTASIDPELTIHADYNVMSSVLRNLASNAVKFSDQGGEVVIEATANANNGATFRVCDQGPGIGAEDVAKLFRIDADTKSIGSPQGKGTGLGLILCKELLDKEGGEIWVESVKGQGSTFSFTIP